MSFETDYYLSFEQKEEFMKIGYARVSTLEQNVDLQQDALEKAGCEKFFRDVASGAKDERKGLLDAIEFARKGDTLVVWKLDRLGRSLKHLIETINTLHQKGVGFASLQENIDTTTPGGKLIFHVFGALAEFERELIRERTNAGLQAARVRGKRGGRPQKLTEKQIEIAQTLMKDPTVTIDSICKTFNVTRPTLYRYCPSPFNRKNKK